MGPLYATQTKFYFNIVFYSRESDSYSPFFKGVLSGSSDSLTEPVLSLAEKQMLVRQGRELPYEEKGLITERVPLSTLVAQQKTTLLRGVMANLYGLENPVVSKELWKQVHRLQSHQSDLYDLGRGVENTLLPDLDERTTRLKGIVNESRKVC
ncbi:22890_t:CDS:2 [Dentiscutata erythropus]|uniref:22890_t:CDS:1 n=1 Tax=Dentiscutata erythropus TaxID=1348616 RepID=A0A9N9DGU2_9GLOM|nr:22890_t:CDS:2 [Dentiscutata erythropus]